MPISSPILTVNHNINESFLDLGEDHKKELVYGAAAAVSGCLYFFIAAAGADNLKALFGLDDQDRGFIDFTYLLGAGAGVCFATFTYKVLVNLTLKPDSPLSKALALFAPISASSFLVAGMEGAEMIGLNPYVAVGIGIALYAYRTLSMVDGAVKFPEKAKELLNEWSKAFNEKDKPKMARLIVTLATSIGFSAAATDSIYAASSALLMRVGAVNLFAVSITSYITGTLGALGVFPLTMYWTFRGLNQLTGGGKPDSAGVEKDPTDRYTAIAAIATLPVILGSLGSVTAAHGEMLGRTGSLSTVIRVASSAVYAVAGGVPGLSTLFRAAPSTLSKAGWALLHALPCGRSPLTEEDIEQRQPLNPRNI
jgi:hypothetical protein